MKFLNKKSSIKNIKLGKNVTIVEPVNLYNCELGDNWFIGPFVEIQSNVKIGANTRVQSHSFICENGKKSKKWFIGNGGKFNNDKYKSARNKFVSNNYPKELKKACYDIEEVGGESKRQQVNNRFAKFANLKKHTKSNGSVVNHPIKLDISMENEGDCKCISWGTYVE